MTGARATPEDSPWLLVFGGVALGATFGALTSLVNAASSPFSAMGGHVAQTGWGWLARVASLLLGAGWAWAALAVLAGLLAGAPARAAVAGAGALLAATATYYTVDTVLLQQSLFSFLPELGYWFAASLLLGPVLGAVGALSKSPRITGLLAALTVPVGAALQMLLLPPGFDGRIVRPEAVWARTFVWAAAAALAAAAVARYLRQRPAGVVLETPTRT